MFLIRFSYVIFLNDVLALLKNSAIMCLSISGWCGAGADHYEPLFAHPLPFISQEKAAVVL